MVSGLVAPFHFAIALEIVGGRLPTPEGGGKKKEKSAGDISPSWRGSRFIIDLFPNRQVEEGSAAR